MMISDDIGDLMMTHHVEQAERVEEASLRVFKLLLLNGLLLLRLPPPHLKIRFEKVFFLQTPTFFFLFTLPLPVPPPGLLTSLLTPLLIPFLLKLSSPWQTARRREHCRRRLNRFI